MGDTAASDYRCRVIPGSRACFRDRAPLRRAALVAPLLLLVALAAGPAEAAGPRGVDGVPSAIAGGPSGHAPAVSLPGDGVLEPPQIVFHGPRTHRVVALTFDDGYAPANVRQIFGELKQAGVVATFFVNGAYLRWDPKLWRSIAAAGYPIGNHTVLHEDVRARPPGQVQADLTRNARLVLEATGRPMIPVFRPPYGYHDAASDAAAVAAGFPTIVLWDVTGGDASTHATDASVLANASAGRPGSIVLLHAGPSVTPRILPALIARYRARGFTFVTLPELLGIPVPDAAVSPVDEPATPPAQGPIVAPTPPAVPPAGDDHGVVPAPTVTPVAPGDVPVASASPTLPRGDLVAGRLPDATPPASPAGWDALPGGATAAGPRGAAGPGAAAADATLARDSAWARGPLRDSIVAAATVGLILLLLLIGAIAGRRIRAGG